MGRIGPADVGHRVVVRCMLPGQTGPSGGQAYTDVLGILEHCDEHTLRVRRSDDTIVKLPIREVARAKRIPPAPTPRTR